MTRPITKALSYLRAVEAQDNLSPEQKVARDFDRLQAYLLGGPSPWPSTLLTREELEKDLERKI